jgi:hypothetical protein
MEAPGGPFHEAGLEIDIHPLDRRAFLGQRQLKLASRPRPHRQRTFDPTHRIAVQPEQRRADAGFDGQGTVRIDHRAFGFKAAVPSEGKIQKISQ